MPLHLAKSFTSCFFSVTSVLYNHLCKIRAMGEMVQNFTLKGLLTIIWSCVIMQLVDYLCECGTSCTVCFELLNITCATLYSSICCRAPVQYQYVIAVIFLYIDVLNFFLVENACGTTYFMIAACLRCALKHSVWFYLLSQWLQKIFTHFCILYEIW